MSGRSALISLAKAKLSGAGGVVEGLDAHAVADAPQPPPRLIPEGEGEHAVEAVEAVDAVLGIGLEQDFGIGIGAEVVALARILRGVRDNCRFRR